MGEWGWGCSRWECGGGGGGGGGGWRGGGGGGGSEMDLKWGRSSSMPGTRTKEPIRKKQDQTQSIAQRYIQTLDTDSSIWLCNRSERGLLLHLGIPQVSGWPIAGVGHGVG